MISERQITFVCSKGAEMRKFFPNSIIISKSNSRMIKQNWFQPSLAKNVSFTGDLRKGGRISEKLSLKHLHLPQMSYCVPILKYFWGFLRSIGMTKRQKKDPWYLALNSRKKVQEFWKIWFRQNVFKNRSKPDFSLNESPLLGTLETIPQQSDLNNYF